MGGPDASRRVVEPCLAEGVPISAKTATLDTSLDTSVSHHTRKLNVWLWGDRLRGDDGKVALQSL